MTLSLVLPIYRNWSI